ncbi:MAG: PASTA domain-containing protein [Bacteroidetes bacterium]|nr:PASTA domain-containing protein [Bacteroidota bacterium]
MNFIQFIITKRFVKHLAISLLITLIISWITLILLQRYTNHGASVEVPNFVGNSLNDLNKIESLGEFDISVVDSVYDYTKKGGTIISQDPLPKSKVKPGRTIYLSVVAFLPEQVKLPALVDLSLRQAKALLQTYGLKLGFVKIIPDPAKNAVIQVTYKGRTIQAGASIQKGSLIDLYVGSGSGGNESYIPFLIGKTRKEAISDIVRAGLSLGSENYDSGADSLNAKVYMQAPMYVYGKKIPVGTTLNLTYKAEGLFDFENYIQSLVIDTVLNDSIQP